MIAEEILEIKYPCVLFPQMKTITQDYLRYSKICHPDAGGSDDSFHHLTLMRDLRLVEEEAGYSCTNNRIFTYGTQPLILGYKSMHEFELGTVYVGNSHITYFIKDEFCKLLQLDSRELFSFKYPDKNMEREVSRFLPKLKNKVRVPAGMFYVIEKEPSLHLVADILKRTPFPNEHAAWLMSRLYGLGCYMQISGIVHCDISPTTVLVDADNHKAFLVGGWWYACKAGDTLKFLPKRILEVVPTSVLDTKQANPALMSEQIKAMG